MVKELKSEVKIVDREGSKVLVKEYEYELSLEEIKKFSDNISGQIKTCEANLKKCDDEHYKKALEEIKLKALNELETKKDALKNFEKYKHDTIVKFKRDANKKFKELMDFCNPEVFEKYLELITKGTRQEFDKNIEIFETQIKELTPLYAAYGEYFDGNN